MRRSILTLLLALALPLAAKAPKLAPAAELNWLRNAAFQGPGEWQTPVEVAAGPQGMQAAHVQSTKAMWKGYTQRVDLPQPSPPALELSAWVKVQDVVAGVHEWEMARVVLVFYDAAGKQVGGWPAPVAQLKGTQDWAFYSNQYSVPAGAARVDVSLILDSCTGEAWFAAPSCLVYDFDEKPLARGIKATHPERAAAAVAPTENWLINPGFETPGSKDWGMGRVVQPGHASLHALSQQNTVPSWNQGQQTVAFKGASVSAVVLGGWVKTRGVVRGKEAWETARIGIDFRDAQGKQVGGWQDTVCKLLGDNDWAYVEKRYPVPPGAAMAVVDAGLGNCTGQAWFDDLSLKLLDGDGNALSTVLSDRQRSDTHDWWAAVPPSTPDGTALDLSFLNEVPAGKRGFVGIRKGHLAFADGTRVRFWGSDFVGPNHFMDKAQADAVASRLAKLGVNLMRLHMPDAAWSEKNLFDSQAADTQSFDAPRLDQLDYLLAALKRHGIYLYVDFMVARRFRDGDGVEGAKDLEDGAKGVVHFDPRIIALNKKYAHDLLSHVNPYTGLALKDDPAYVASEIVNESSIFSGFGEHKFPEAYFQQLQRRFEAQGGQGELSRFKFDWETQKLVPLRAPENAEASLRFLYKLVAASDLDMQAFLKKLAPHALLTGSNMGLPVLGNLRSDALLDHMDTHAYWDHPQIWNVEGGWANVAIAPFDNKAQLLNPFQGSLLFNLAHAAVEGKPLLVTEWNDCVPNEFRLEGPLLMAAYGSLQDWDGLLQFDFSNSLPGSTALGNFGINTRPDNEPLYQAGALIFRSALLQPATQTVVEPVSDAQVFANGMQSPWLFENPWLPYVAKVAKRFTGAQAGARADLTSLQGLYDRQHKTLTSTTGEERLDYGHGILRLDSPQVQGLCGAIGTGQELGSGGLKVDLTQRQPWAAVLALSLDGKPLRQAAKAVLVAVARAENSGQVYNASRTALKVPGGLPVLMQGVQGAVSLAVDGKRYRVSPLDPDGAVGGALPAGVEGGVLRFNLAPGDHCSDYLVERLD